MSNLSPKVQELVEQIATSIARNAGVLRTPETDGVDIATVAGNLDELASALRKVHEAIQHGA